MTTAFETAFEQAAAEHHADRCNGLPLFEQVPAELLAGGAT